MKHIFLYCATLFLIMLYGCAPFWDYLREKPPQRKPLEGLIVRSITLEGDTIGVMARKLQERLILAGATINENGIHLEGVARYGFTAIASSIPPYREETIPKYLIISLQSSLDSNYSLCASVEVRRSNFKPTVRELSMMDFAYAASERIVEIFAKQYAMAMTSKNKKKYAPS